jgi:kynurenine formamidase
MNRLTTLTELIGNARIVELGHVLEEGIPVWPTHSRFFKMPWHSPDKGDSSTNFQIILNEHNGTHADAMLHYDQKNGKSIDQLPPETFLGPCCVMHFETLGKNGVVGPEHILAWEKEHGAVAPGDIVILDFGWHRLWKRMPDHTPYITDSPGLGGAGAELLRERGAKLVGCDVLGVDALCNTDDPAHHALLCHGVAIVENLNNLGALPPRCFFLALPLRIKGGSGSPIRPLALIYD